MPLLSESSLGFLSYCIPRSLYAYRALPPYYFFGTSLAFSLASRLTWLTVAFSWWFGTCGVDAPSLVSRSAALLPYRPLWPGVYRTNTLSLFFSRALVRTTFAYEVVRGSSTSAFTTAVLLRYSVAFFSGLLANYCTPLRAPTVFASTTSATGKGPDCSLITFPPWATRSPYFA